jgi:hypothetical protein
VVEKRDDVTGQRRDGHRPVHVGGMPMALQLDGDHLPARSKRFEQQPEVEVDGHQSTMEQHEWPTRTMGLVVQLQAV